MFIGLRRAFLAVALLVAVLPGCTSSSDADRQVGAAEPSNATEATGATEGTEATEAVGPTFYLPSQLPEGFELVGLRYYETSDALMLPDAVESQTIVIGDSDWVTETSLILDARRFATAEDLELALGVEDGLVVLDGGPDQSLLVNGSPFVYKSLSPGGRGPVEGGYFYGVVDEVLVSGFIFGPMTQSSLSQIISTIEVTSDEGLALSVDGSAADLDIAIHEASGQERRLLQALGDYELVFSDGTDRFNVMVSPGFAGGLMALKPPFVPGDRLVGELGSGYIISQPEVGGALGSRRLNWWVPTVRVDVLFGRVLSDEEAMVVAESFEEVGAAEWQTATAGLDVTTDVIGPESLPENPRATVQELTAEQDREAELPELDIADITEFVGEMRGGSFAEEPEIAWIGPVELDLQTASQDFFPDDVEHVYRALRILSWSDLPSQFAEARRLHIRGLCCGPNSITLVEGMDTVEATVVAAHELTHLFDTMSVETSFRDSAELIDTTRAVLEGNANRVMLAYNDDRELGYDASPREYVSYDFRPRSEVRRTVEFAYDEGQRFITAIAEAGGEAAVNQALADPPTSSEQILHPEKYLAGEEAIIVAPPEVPGDFEIVGRGTLGAFVIALTTPRGWGWDNSVELVGSWAGDSFVAWEQDDMLCVAADIVFDDDVAAATFERRTTAESAVATGAQVSVLSCGRKGQF